MLRTAEISPFRSSRVVRAARAACLACLLVVAAVVAGIRPPATPVQAAEGEPAKETPRVAETEVKAEGYDFSYVPDDALFVIAIRPDQMAASPQLKPLADLLEKNMRPAIPLASLSQLTFAMPRPINDATGQVIHGSSSEYTLVRASQPFDFKKSLTESYGLIGEEDYQGRTLLTQTQGGSITFFTPNDRTLISYTKPGLERVISDPQAAAGPKNASQWSGELNGPLFAVGNPAVIRQMMSPQSMMNQFLGPVFDAAEKLTVATEDGETFVVRATIVCRKAEDVPRVEQTLQSIALLARNSVDSLAALQRKGASNSAYSLPFVQVGKAALDSLVIKAEGATVTVTAKIANAKSAIAELIPQFTQAQTASRRSQSANNLRNLALGALTYTDTNGSYPPSIVYGKSGFPQLNSSGDKSAHVPRSWRVELLPALGLEGLYKQYRLDQPWDSEANLKVLKQMPAVYRSPFDDPKSTNTSYFAMTGPGTVFDGEEGTPIRAITDGTSNTLLWVEAKREIPWTKPEDVVYDPAKDVPKLGGWMENGEFSAAYCDGSVRVLREMPEEELRGVIEKGDMSSQDQETVPRE